MECARQVMITLDDDQISKIKSLFIYVFIYPRPAPLLDFLYKDFLEE